jgi:hypothetical protein
MHHGEEAAQETVREAVREAVQQAPQQAPQETVREAVQEVARVAEEQHVVGQSGRRPPRRPPMLLYKVF